MSDGYDEDSQGILTGYNPSTGKATHWNDKPQTQTASLTEPKKKTPEEEVEPYFQEQKAADQAYANKYETYSDQYANRLSGLNQQSVNQANNANQVYQNTILPEAKNYLTQAKQNMSGAMSLQSAQDPNNPVAASFRNFYDQQAQGERSKGLADVGVLQSLGAQAFNTQMGSGGPMTGSQMQLLQAGTQAQSGQAFANVQKRMQNLRDQGIQEGWNQTDKAYNRGEAARDRYASGISGLQGIQSKNLAEQQGLRGEQAGYYGGIMGAGMGSAEAQYGAASQDPARRFAYKSGLQGMANQQSMLNQQLSAQQSMADKQNRANMISGLLGAGGMAAGAYFGGPMGAAAGGTAGSTLGGMVA